MNHPCQCWPAGSDKSRGRRLVTICAELKDFDGLMAWVHDYCKANPLTKVTTGAAMLAGALPVGIDHRTSAVFGFAAALRVTTGDVPGLATKSK